MPTPRKKPPRRGRSGPAKLTEDNVRAMRRMYFDDGLCHRCIGKLFGVHWRTAQDAINGTTWSDVK